MEGIVRKGKVSSVNEGKREARVYFPEDDFMSGWLKVIKFSEPPQELPKIGDIVICIYETGFNGDGYVLGAL